VPDGGPTPTARIYHPEPATASPGPHAAAGQNAALASNIGRPPASSLAAHRDRGQISPGRARGHPASISTAEQTVPIFGDPGQASSEEHPVPNDGGSPARGIRSRRPGHAAPSICAAQSEAEVTDLTAPERAIGIAPVAGTPFGDTGPVGSGVDSEKPPRGGHAFEFVFIAILEGDI